MYKDEEDLRDELIDFYGTATGEYPMAMMDVIELERASYDDLIKKARENNFDVDDHEDTEPKTRKR